MNICNLELDGQHVFLRTFNSTAKQPVLILHGWNRVGSKSWEDFLTYFAQENPNLHLIAPDLPGFGNSPEPTKNWLAEEYADFLYLLLLKYRQQKPELESKWNIIGHSFGGGISCIIGAKYQKICSSLVLVAPAIVRKPLSKNQKLTVRLTKKIKNYVKTISKILPNIFNNFTRKVWYKFFGSSDYLDLSPRMSEIMKLVVRQDLTSWLPKISLPTLILWGTLDTYTPYKDSTKIKNLILNSKLVTYNKANHGIHLYNQEVLAKEIKLFYFSKKI